MTENGYIKLFRKMLKWEWYSDSVTKDVFLHLLLTANYEDGRYKGIEVKRGQVLTSVRKLAKELGFTERKIRTAINHLISTHEVTQQVTHRYTLITLNNFDTFQSQSDTVSDTVPTQYRHSTDTVAYNIKRNKEYKEDKNIYITSPIVPSLNAADDVKAQIEYDWLSEEIPTEFLDLVVDIIRENGDAKLRQLDSDDIEYVYNNGWLNAKDVRNPRGYLRSLLLYAKAENKAITEKLFKNLEENYD